MSNIVDLSQIGKDRKERREDAARKRKIESRRLRTKPQFIQVAATTIGAFLQFINWAVQHSKPVDTDHLQLLGDSCNYQLQCFSRAYGWQLTDDPDSIPVRFELDVDVDYKENVFGLNFSILGELAEPVQMILSSANPELEEVDPEQSDGK